VSDAPARCIVCGDAPRPYLQKAGFSLVRCPGCGLEWRAEFPDAAELASLYGPGYLARWGATDTSEMARVRAMKHASFADFLRDVRSEVRGGRLLDVGCATGFLMEVADADGFEVYGLDRNAEGVALARERFGDRVHCGDLADAPFDGIDFDVVTAIDVFEHVTDPGALLDGIEARLRPGGVLAAVLPNAGSAVRRLLGGRWPHYVAEHLFHWSRGNLERFLTERGWRVQRIRVGVRKTFTGHYLAAYAACAGGWLPPGVGLLGDRRVRVPTGEMLVLATPRPPGASEAG
jgi:SAM-dependent methyltransferase